MSKIEKFKSTEGHRQRLRNRFLKSGISGFLDYEIVELLLTLGTPRKDCKVTAKKAIEKFGGLKGVLDASFDELQQVEGIGPSNAFGIKLFQAISQKYSEEHLPDRLKLDSSQATADFLQKSIGREIKEHFVVLSLDSRNCLIRVSEISVGSLSSSVVHPREVFKEAIQSAAAQIIMGHNHPSGNPEPSPEDVALTRRLIEGARIFGIELLDHVIVTTDKFHSMKASNLI